MGLKTPGPGSFNPTVNNKKDNNLFMFKTNDNKNLIYLIYYYNYKIVNLRLISLYNKLKANSQRLGQKTLRIIIIYE